MKAGKKDWARALNAPAQERMMAIFTSISAQMIRGARSQVGSVRGMRLEAFVSEKGHGRYTYPVLVAQPARI